MNGKIKWQREINHITELLNQSKTEYTDCNRFSVIGNNYSIYITDYLEHSQYKNLIMVCLLNKKCCFWFENRYSMIKNSDKIINYLARKLYEYKILENL